MGFGKTGVVFFLGMVASPSICYILYWHVGRRIMGMRGVWCQIEDPTKENAPLFPLLDFLPYFTENRHLLGIRCVYVYKGVGPVIYFAEEG